MGKKLLAILIDPEKTSAAEIGSLGHAIETSAATHIFVGGSTFEGSMDAIVCELKKIGLPVVIFPGHPSHISAVADALLLLVLASGQNPDYLIGHHVLAAPTLKKSGLEIIPAGYILIDGGTQSAVARVTQTKPLSDIGTIVNTAIACEMLGYKLIYLEAGSGALHPVGPEIILAVRESVSIPVIVGGGMKTKKAIQEEFEAGADMADIGPAFEQDPEFFLHG